MLRDLPSQGTHVCVVTVLTLRNMRQKHFRLYVLPLPRLCGKICVYFTWEIRLKAFQTTPFSSSFDYYVCCRSP